MGSRITSPNLKLLPFMKKPHFLQMHHHDPQVVGEVIVREPQPSQLVRPRALETA